MFTASNSLSFIRAPLAFLFLQDSVILRVIAVLLAMTTDMVDGHLARKNQSVSKFGAVLDPAMDKFFVYFALTALFLEEKVALWQIATLLSRDFALCFYGLAMAILRRWKSVILFRAIRWGKVTTGLQFSILIGLIVGVSFPWYIFGMFAVIGYLALMELFQTRPSAV